eukprot:m.1054505 g.1054505  ORF g.1054505 m.1054505 type:complete len:1013 (+) comp24189_c0_seq2:178-3216(+)
MASRMRRGNSLVRGSGHSFANHKANRGSILRKSKVVQGKTVEEDAAVFDLILLSKIGEDAVIQNISNMYYEDLIYSYIGNVVISMNPFKDLPIYDQKTIDKYRGRSAFDPKLPPHIFALADNVFSDMKWRGRDQVVIISGESGAGKTEAAKKIMQYVAAVSGSTDKANGIKDKLLETNPLLESFGNAKTTRNDNSSRFGKYMDIQFDHKGDPSGGIITTYLLEKARVCRLADGERNFHIFYQLLKGKASGFGLATDSKSYALLKDGGSPVVKGMNDDKWFKDVSKGFNAIGFSTSEVDSIWKALAAILLLGNVTFKSAGSAGSTIDKYSDKLPTLLETSKDKINYALTHNTVMVNGQPVAADLTADGARHSRDTLCKTMYNRLFVWMCERINQSIAVDSREVKAVIGVLDIYGFEIFAVNSFEQFCINYCNEKLQQLFIELTLKTEQDEYVNEGIKWTPIEYFNNKIICDLVDSKRNGIVATLDEESIRPGEKSDKVWLEKMTKVVGKHAHYEVRKGPSDKSLPANAFKLKHYAGDVVYTVDGFLDKNTDTLYKDLAKLMFESKNTVLKACFPEGDQKKWAGASKRPLTAGRIFVNSMNAMIDVLNTKVPSYVRCIKPNHTRSVHKIEPDLMQHQVKYLGLVENVRVRRAGYCFRETYEDFFWRYRMLSPETFPNYSGSKKDACVKIFNALGIRSKEYELGKTKVFIKHPTVVFRIEEERDDKLDTIATRLQMGWRLYLVNKVIGGWFKEMDEKFHPVRNLDGNAPKYGFAPSRVKFPPHKPQLKTSADFLKGVYGHWWARKMVGTLPADKQTLMRTQFLGHGFFARKKKNFTIARGLFDDGIHAQHTDPEGYLRQKFEMAHGKILFCAEVDKISKKLKAAKRVVVITEDSLYRTDVKWKVVPSRVLPLESITGVTVRRETDAVAVVHSDEGHDIVFNFSQGEKNLVYNFVVFLAMSLAARGKRKLDVKLVDEISFNNTGKAGNVRTLDFLQDPAETPGTTWQDKTKKFVYF